MPIHTKWVNLSRNLEYLIWSSPGVLDRKKSSAEAGFNNLINNTSKKVKILFSTQFAPIYGNVEPNAEFYINDFLFLVDDSGIYISPLTGTS